MYIEELTGGVRTISTVTTSVTAFVGHTRRGPVNQPVTVTSFSDFERRFGGLTADSPVSYAVQQFYLNGGSLAVVVRVTASGSGALAGTTLSSTAGQSRTPALRVTAAEPGAWGSGLRVTADHDTQAPSDTFNLRVFGSAGEARESFTGLSMEEDSGRYAPTVVNAASSLIRLEALSPQLPDPSGTVSKPFADPLPDLGVTVTVGIGEQERQLTLHDPGRDGEPPATVTGLALLLERKLRSLPDAPGRRAFAGATVTPFGRRLQVVAGSTDPRDVVRFVGESANDLGLEASVQPPAFPLEGGEDGEPPRWTDLIGSEAEKTGIQALRDVADVNLLCLPGLSASPAQEMVSVLSAADALCGDKRMFHIVDAPDSWGSLEAARAGLADFEPVRSGHAALYFPHLEMTDPLTGRLRRFPPSGAVAGLMARTDSTRGVWKAPAGTDARLAGVRALTVPMTDPENGLLNPLGVNCLRSFPVIGPVVWGARTLEGADALGSAWKYVPVRRLALFLEESLFRGLKWVVFEPNDERLWSQIRLNAGAFLHTQFQRGAFQGSSPRESYFVKCDKDTTTQADIDRGIVNVVVGFAPVKPAEFVIVKIEQMAGQFEI
ncbi:hypothetical protein GCM10009716_35630 [Streptomyces sodiiphilus]|uniref:Phage tail protein n=1 Tax=Streptomyces sodiiphilus TaxID=226217 RepID=A0ABN2PKD4_9ACTN